MKKCDIRFKVENDLTTIGAVDESNNIQDITAVTEYKNQFDKEARFFYNYKKEVFAFDGYQLKFNESNLKEFNKIQKNENNYYRTRLGDNLVTVRENLEVFVEQGLNSVENFNFKDKENKLFDKGIPFENISIEQRQALSKQNIIYPANIINKTDLPIEIKNYVNLYNQYISLNSSNRANFATNRSVINENTVLYLDSANKLNYIMAASDLASLEESEVHGNNYLSIALAQRGEQEDVNISESVSDNPVYAKRIKELKTELKELVDKRGRVLPGKEQQYKNAKKHLAFLEQSVSDQMRFAIIFFLQENKIKVNYSLANSLYEIAIKSDTTADFHEKMQDRFYNDIKLPFAFSYFDSWGMSISELMKKEYNRINTESKKFDGKDGIYIERTHTAKDFNNYIRKNGDRQTKYIWKLIKNVAFKINPKIKFVFEENFRGHNYAEAFTQDQTDFKSTRIEIRASLLQNPKRAATTLVHEIIHSIAHNIIDIVLFNEKKQIHLLTERQINAVKELTKLIKEVQANDKTNKFYGATDEHELLSELTNKEFVEALKEKAPNIFRRIQNFFLDILGIEKNKYRRAEAILKDIISKPVHLAEIGNTIYPGLFPQKTFYKNDFLESVADSKFINKPVFDKELAQKIQDKLQKLYPEIKLNITNNPIWEQGDNIFNQEEYNNQVNYRLKATEILLSDKAKQVFAKGEKAKWDLNKILTELAIPKEQKQLILDLGITDREQIALELASKYGFSVEVNTAKERKIKKDLEYSNFTSNGFVYQHTSRYGYIKSKEEDKYNPDKYIKISKQEFIDEYNKDVKEQPTQHYSNLTVPGGTNYTENEISTPLIIPSIKGHAQFSTNKGIGWFRSDEQYKTSKDYPLSFKGNYGDTWEKRNNIWYTIDSDGITHKRDDLDDTDVYSIYDNQYGNKDYIQKGENTKTRRILEIQSDLFQKGRDREDLALNKNTKREFITPEPGIPAEVWGKEDTKGNKNSNESRFLQLLNKDNNWVTFFIKSIIQDSAKKGYEKVLFPKGETAAKIEGHETIADEIQKINDELRDLNNLDKYFIANQDIVYYKQGNNYYVVHEEGKFSIKKETFEKYKKDADNTEQISRLEKRKSELKSQGIEKLKPIEGFYEIKVGNILEKLFGKDNVKTITDEYGNQWREITINQARDLSNILLQRDEANRIIGQANIKAMTVLIDAINKKADTLPHEYAHHYIAWFRDTPIVQEGIKKWGSEEALVQSIGEQVVKQKGEAYNWWNEFVKWIINQFNSLSKLQKEELTQILTDAFLTRQDLGSQQESDNSLSDFISQKSQKRLNQIQDIFNENPELANSVYEALGFEGNNSLENKLKVFFNQFGFQYKEGESSTDLLNKIIYTSKKDNSVFIDNSVKALSQLLLANTNIDFHKLESLIEDTPEFKKLLSNSSDYLKTTHKFLKDGNRIPIEEWIAYIKQYNKIKNEVLEKYLKESLLDNNNLTGLHKLINDFLKWFRDLFVNAKNLKEVTDSLVQQALLNQREVIINSKDLQNKERVTLAKALEETTHGKDIIKTFGEFGLILTGSVSAAEQGSIFRKTGKLLHDIDWVVPKGFTKDFNKKLKDTFPGVTLVREFDSPTYYTQTYIVPPKGYTISNLTFFKPETYGERKYIASYDVLDKNGNVVSNYRRYYDVKESGKVVENREIYNEGLENVDKNLEAVSVDFFQQKEDLKHEPYTANVEGVNLQLANWLSSFTEKLKYGRAKDLLDYANFIPDDVIPSITQITQQQQQQAQQVYSQYLDSLNKPNTNPILQNNQQEQVKKFAELQERLNNKEFLEGAKNAYENSEELKSFGTQEEYNDYIARVSLGIIKNPSSGEYNYTSKVKDIVYHGSPIKHDIFKTVDENAREERFKHIGAMFTSDKNYTKAFGENLYSVVLNIKNPITLSDSTGINSTFVATQYYSKWKNENKDGVIGHDALLDLEHISEGTEYVVFDPEQIHILGSQSDIQGFKEFVQKDNSSEINSSVSDDIDFNRESNKSNISENISDNVNTQEGLNLTKSITVDETTNTVNINDILVNGTTTIKATSEFTIEGISDSNIETLIIEAPSVNVNTENFNVETLIIKTESQTSFPDINISQNSNIKSLQIQNSNTNLEITDLTSENNLVFKNFVFADKNDCFLDNFTETSGFTINSAEPFKYSLAFDNSKNLTILQTNELKEIPVSIRNIENLTLEEDVEINIVSMQTTALNLNVNENNIIRLEKKYEKAAINIQAEEPTNITLHGKTRVNLDFKDKFVSINNNVSLTKDSDISFQEEAWSETEKFQEQQEKVLEKQYDSVEEYIDNDDPFDLKTSIDSYISEFNSINPELKKTTKIVQVEADSHAIYRENHTTTLTISESVADILEDRSPYIKVSEEEATNALMSSLNPASFLTVNEQLLATSVLDIDIDHLANKIISGLIYINVNSVGMNVRTLFDNLTHLKEQFKDEKVVLENLKKLDSKLNEKYAELKVRIQKDSVTYSERVHKALEDTVLDENEETQQKRVLELSRKKLNAFYTEQVNTLYKQLKEVTKQIELLLQEDTSAEFRVPAALKIKLQEKITELKDQRLRVRNLRAEDIVSEFTVSLSNLTPLLDSYTEFIKFLEDNKEEINSVTLTHTIDKTIQDLVIALGQEQSKMETAKLLAFKDGKKVPETALDAYTSEMLKSLAGRVQLLSTRTSALARQSFFKYAAEVLNVDVADIAREIKALQDNGLPDTHILDEWFFDPTKGLFMPDKAGLFPSLMQMTLDSEINAWRSYAIRLSTDLNNVKEEGDKALKKIRINGRKMNALDFKARNKYGRYTKHFIDVYNEDYIQNYKAVWRTLNELLKSKLDTPEKKNKSLKPFIDQIANQYEAVNIFKLSAFADLKGKRLPVYMDIDFQVDAEYEQSLKDKYGEEVFNYLVEQSKEKFLNKIQNWEYDFKAVAVANNAESFAELQAKNPEAANTLLEKLKDRLPLPSDFKDASYVAKTKLFVNSFTVPTSTKVFNKFFIDNVLGNETIRKYYTALKNLENYIINQKNELDNVSYAAPLVKYKTFLEHFTDNRENHSFLMKTSAAFRSLFKDVNKLWFKTYKVPGEVTGIATQESLSIIPKAVPSNFYKNQMAIKKIAEAANSAVLTKKIPATSDSFVHFIFEKVANLPFVKGVTTVEDLMTEFNEIRANYVRISDAQNAVINSLLTHLEYEKSSTDLAETLKAHLLIINMATSRNMAQGKINILLRYFQDIKKTIKQKGTTTVSDRVRAKALSAVQTWYDKNIIGANLEADPDSAGKLRLGKEDRELLEYLRKEGILTEKESKEIQPFFTYKKLSAGAIVTAFLKYTIWKGLGWNMKSGTTNFMQGMFDDFIAGASGKYYTADYYYKALRMLPQSMFKFFTFSHKLVPKALRRNLENSDAVKFRRLMDKFKVLQDSSNLLQQAGKNEKFLNTQKLDAFHWQKSIEYLNQGVLILGEIYSRDIQIDENTKVKLWDLFDQQSNLKEEYASNKELYINWQLGRGKQFNAFTSKVNKMIVEVHGDYQETRGFKASHSEVGRALILFKKFFPQQVANRWSKKQTVYELGEDTMGRTEDSLDKMQTIGRYRALTPSAAALVGAANIRTSLSAALLRPIFGDRLKPLLSIADAVISPWLLPVTAIGAVIGATWAIAAKLYNGKQKGAKIFGDMPQVLGRTLYGFITTPVNVLAGRELLKNTYSNKSLSALENLAMNESLNDVRITLFMTMLGMLIRWKLHRDPNDDGSDDEESTTDQVLLAILNRIDVNLAEHTQYTDPPSMLQFLDLTESSPANTLAQMINMPIKVQKQMERIEKMTEIEKYFLTDSDYDRASYWVGFKETFLPSPVRKYWGWSSSMNFDFTTEIKTRETKQFVPALYHPIEWLTTTKEQREEKEIEARILNIKNAYKKEFKNLYFDYFQSLDESEKNEFADELKEIINKAMVKPKYLDNEQTLSFFENESMLRAKVNLSIKKFYFTDRFKQQQVKIKNNKEAQAAYNAVIKLFEKQKNDDLYKINGGAILNYSTKYKIYKKEIINRERELKEALNRAGINYIAPKAVEKVVI